jgi:hypothetical protein
MSQVAFPIPAGANATCTRRRQLADQLALPRVQRHPAGGGLGQRPVDRGVGVTRP